MAATFGEQVVSLTWLDKTPGKPRPSEFKPSHFLVSAVFSFDRDAECQSLEVDSEYAIPRTPVSLHSTLQETGWAYLSAVAVFALLSVPLCSTTDVKQCAPIQFTARPPPMYGKCLIGTLSMGTSTSLSPVPAEKPADKADLHSEIALRMWAEVAALQPIRSLILRHLPLCHASTYKSETSSPAPAPL